jgi:hypothetical protein
MQLFNNLTDSLRELFPYESHPTIEVSVNNTSYNYFSTLFNNEVKKSKMFIMNNNENTLDFKVMHLETPNFKLIVKIKN